MQGHSGALRGPTYSAVSMSCSDKVLGIARFDNNGGLTCSASGGYDFVIAAAPISASKASIMCSVNACKELVAAIKGAVPRECAYTSMSQVELQLYKDILDPIDAACKSGATPTTTTPATTTVAPAPPTKAPSPTVTTPKPTTASPSSSSASPDGSASSVDSSSFGSTNTDSFTPVPPSASADNNVSSQSGTTIATNTTQESGDSTPTIIGISIGAVVVVAVIAYLFGRSRRRDHTRSTVGGPAYEDASNGTCIPHTGTTIATGMSGASKGKASIPIGLAGGTIGLWSDRDIQNARIPLEDIKLGPILSAGAFGEVLLASYNGEKVAVKRLLPARRKDMTQIESFLEEAKLMTTLRHQRIVRLIGVAWDSLTDLCVVTEFMNGGDLRTLLAGFASRNAQVGFTSDKVKIAVHVVHALSYLHGLRPTVVHRDLKSKNVLLSDALNAKLTDFGVSRTHAELTMTAGVGSSLWMAPEIMLGERYDEKADIFSFGVVMSELDTHRLPYSDAVEPGTDRQLSAMAILNMVSQGQLEVTFSDRADADVIAIGRACTLINPQDRPSAKEVLRQLHHVWQSYGGTM